MMAKKSKKPNQQYMLLEDNKGGDYIAIRVIDPANIEIEVGHCCVVSFRKILPVAMLTDVLSGWFFAGMQLHTWKNCEYGESLNARVHDVPKDGPSLHTLAWRALNE